MQRSASFVSFSSEYETLQIDLPHQDITLSSFDGFTDMNNDYVNNLIILQDKYNSYERYTFESNASVVTIPETITQLTQLESISITARIETLPKCLCELQRL